MQPDPPEDNVVKTDWNMNELYDKRVSYRVKKGEKSYSGTGRFLPITKENGDQVITIQVVTHVEKQNIYKEFQLDQKQANLIKGAETDSGVDFTCFE